MTRRLLVSTHHVIFSYQLLTTSQLVYDIKFLNLHWHTYVVFLSWALELIFCDEISFPPSSQYVNVNLYHQRGAQTFFHHLQLVKSAEMEQYTFEAILFLAILANYHKSDAAKLNPYLKRIRETTDTDFMGKLCWASNFALGTSIKYRRSHCCVEMVLTFPGLINLSRMMLFLPHCPLALWLHVYDLTVSSRRYLLVFRQINSRTCKKFINSCAC